MSHFPILILLLQVISYLCSQDFDFLSPDFHLDTIHTSKFLWGTYKPNLYFAMKNRKHKSNVFGIMWYQPSSDSFLRFGDISNRLRHDCRMEDLLNYRWEYHNGIDYGSQVIEDMIQNNLVLKTKFIKRTYHSSLDQKWDVVIQGDVYQDLQPKKLTSIVLYFSMEMLETKTGFLGIDATSEGFLNITFHKNGIKKHRIVVESPVKQLISSSFKTYYKPSNETWNIKKFIEQDIREQELKLFNSNNSWSYHNLTSLPVANTSNIVAIQFTLSPPFDILVHFTTLLNHEDSIPSLSYLNTLFYQKELEFNQIFTEKFQINYESLYGVCSNNAEMQLVFQMAKEALSNLLGGIGYSYGNIKIDLDDSKVEAGKFNPGYRYAIEPKGIFTSTSSRTMFPWGRLKDVGFEHMVISKWDINMSIDIIDSWLRVMSKTGWIANEQTRGNEIMSKVPLDRSSQYHLIANPPTLILPIESIIHYYQYLRDGKKSQYVLNFLHKCYKKLSLWFKWFDNTQKTHDSNNLYQWFGRDETQNYASGFDDYPRAMIRNNAERHLDLYIWVIELTKTLKHLSEIIDSEMVQFYETKLNSFLEGLNPLFFDRVTGLYCDFLGPQQQENKISNGTYNPHIGYVNLYPLIFGILSPSDPIFRTTLSYLSSHSELFSHYGIRSLSMRDKFYHSGEDNWRGNIGLQMNYLILRGLFKYYIDDSEAVRIYSSLRTNLIYTVFNSWKKSGMFYEQYGDQNGEGYRARPFNGYTSLIVNIISEQYEN